MIPNYGFSPSNLYDFDWYYFTDIALLLRRGCFVVFCTRRGHYRDTANIASCGYADTYGNEHGRSHSRSTGHINGRSDGHCGDADRQPNPAFHTRSICDPDSSADIATDFYADSNGNTIAHIHTNTIHYTDLDPNGNTDNCCYPGTNGNNSTHGNQYTSSNSDPDHSRYSDKYRRPVSVSNSDADTNIYTNTYGNSVTLTGHVP